MQQIRSPKDLKVNQKMGRLNTQLTIQQTRAVEMELSAEVLKH